MSKLADRFWAAMSERYGKRWFDQYGETISAAWQQLVDAHGPDVVKRALDMLPNVSPEHPPTLPQFESLLHRIGQKDAIDGGQDWMRGYWRSAIVDVLCSELNCDPADLRRLFATNHDFVRAVRVLMDELCDMERKTGQRTPGIESLCARRSIALARMVARAA